MVQCERPESCAASSTVRKLSFLEPRSIDLIMAHTLISIRFRSLRLPVIWNLDNSEQLGPIVTGEGQKWKTSPTEVRLMELDGWQLRDEFFDLRENDLQGLTQFLNKVGVWSSDPESSSFDSSRYPLVAHPDDVWRFRDDLRDALLYRKNFAATVAPELTKPKTLLDLMTLNSANSFPLRFELSDVAAGVVTIMNARLILFATVLADVARGVRFKTCKRKDCRKPFPITSKHSRKFCSQYCGHLVSQREKRAAEQKRKRDEKRTRPRKSLR